MGGRAGDLDVDPSPAGVAQTEEENRQYAQRCTDRVGADVLANVGTRDAARDLDVLRAALGDPKLTYLGYSYGTRLGSTYAEDFPQNVRALVLDGALDPSQSTVDRSVAQAAGFQQAFDAFAAECAKQGNCPLGTDPSKATAAFQAITRPLVDRPVAVGERKLTYPDAITGVTHRLRPPTRVPTDGPDAADAFDGRERPPQVLALVGFRHSSVVDPAPSVTRDLPAGGDHRLRRVGVALERLTDREDGERQPLGGEDPVHPPEAGAAAELEHRLRVEIAPTLGRGRADDLVQERLRGRIALERGVLAAFLVVEHEAERHPRAVRPAWVGRCRTVADEIAGAHSAVPKTPAAASSRTRSGA